jgi:pimeloyl-ACP methyl ester carboxylesterase
VPGAGDQANRDAGGTFDGDLAAMRSWDFDAVGASQITQPVPYIVSSLNADNVEPVTAMVRAAIPHVELVAIDGAHHGLQMTHPTPVARAISQFIRRHPM